MSNLFKDGQIIFMALLIVIVSACYVFNKSEPKKPQYGWPDILGDLEYPQQLNLNYAETKGVTGSTKENNQEKLNSIFYGSNSNSTGNNVCKNFNCNKSGSPLDKKKNPSLKQNTKKTPYCINPNVKNKLDNKICPAKGDECRGNCNILYDTLVKKNIDENSGMKGVEKIFDTIETHTSGSSGSSGTDNKEEVIKQQYKNQIKYLLCQMGQQNIYDYDYDDPKVESIYFTWDNICQMNGWPTCGGKSKIALGFYIISLIVAGWISVKILYGMFVTNNNIAFESLLYSSMPTLSRNSITEIVQYLFSWPLYWIAFIYFCNSILLAKLSRGESVDTLDYSVGGLKLVPILSSLGLWILLPILTAFICKRNSKFGLNTLLTLITVGIVIYYFLIIYYTRIGSSYNIKKILDGNDSSGINWTKDKNITHMTPSINHVTPENTPVLLKIFPYLWGTLALIPLLYYYYVNNRKVNQTLSGGSGKNSVSVIDSASTKSANTSTTPIETDICSKLDSNFKEKGGLFLSNILMITYVSLLSANIFVCLVAPSAFIVLLVFQRLLMTNFIQMEDNDWRRHWDFILLPALHYSIRRMYNLNDEIRGKSNREVFGKIDIPFGKIGNLFGKKNGTRSINDINSNNLLNQLRLVKASGQRQVNSKVLNNMITKINSMSGGGNSKKSRITKLKELIELLRKNPDEITKILDSKYSSKWENIIKDKKEKLQLEDVILACIYLAYKKPTTTSDISNFQEKLK